MIGIAAVSAADNAQAQSQFERNRNVSVRERTHEGYEPIGWHLGGFTAFPSIEGGATYDDNIFAAADGVSDFILFLEPSIDVRSNWSRHRLTAHARLLDREYLDHGREGTTDWEIGSTGRLDAGTARLLLSGQAAHLTEPRTATNTAREARSPIRYDEYILSAGLSREFNRLQLKAATRWRKLDFENGRNPEGGVVFVGNRDREIVKIEGEAAYAVTPALALLVAGGWNRRSYRLEPPVIAIDRSSRGWEAMIGTSFDLTRLARGEVRLGYLHQRYDAAQFGTAKGFGATASIEWFPTQLTTVTFGASRGIEEAAIVGAPSYLATTASARVDHELLRNLILSASAAYQRENYRRIDRTESGFVAGAGAIYALNRNLRLRIAYEHEERDSRGASRGQDFTINRLSFSATLRV